MDEQRAEKQEAHNKACMGHRFGAKAKQIAKGVSVEPIVFLWSIGSSLTMVVTPTLYFDKICKVGSNWFGNGTTFSDYVCDHLDNGNYTEEQEYVQKVYSQVHLVTSYVGALVPVLFIVFLGPWSDRAGRRFLILFPICGFILGSSIQLLNAIFFDDLKVEWLMLESIQSFFGGTAAMFMGCYSYLADVTSSRSRYSRLSWLDASMLVAFTIGLSVSGVLFVEAGYVANYSLQIGCLCLALIYGLTMLKDSFALKELKAKKAEALSKVAGVSEAVPVKRPGLKQIFNPKHVLQSFKVALKKREGGIRHVVIILILMFFLYSVAGGVATIEYSYARIKFDWESSDYMAKWWSTYSSVGTAVHIISLGVLSPIMSRLLKFSDMCIVTISLTTFLLSIMTILLAQVKEMLYLSKALDMFTDLVTLGIRAALTKIVGNQDTGKVFACIGVVQAGSGFIYPLYNVIYLNTLDSHAGMSYCVSETLIIILIALSIYSWFRIRKFNKTHPEETRHLPAGCVEISVL